LNIVKSHWKVVKISLKCP